MVQLTIKSMLLDAMYDGTEYWEEEIIAKVLKQSGHETEYWKWNCRYYLMEYQNGGMLEIVDKRLDDGSHFGENRTLSKYKITEFGKSKVESLLR